jgi:CP family cyanate transporter-like MFS transporter
MDTSTVSPQVNTTAAQSWLLWVGFILVSLNLRLIFTTVGPLLENLQLGFTSTLLVTTLPLALLGLFSMAGVRLRHWL